ncbi:MAG: hypothetical protein IK083_08795, partial [Abditibacteriota bacterium]|nr:hypothetical protein [Abditibacteriota bacterium]
MNRILLILLLIAAAAPSFGGVYLASRYGALDSDVLKGGGTDDTARLQAVLDKALEGEQVTLVMDGAALISGLIIHDNTTVRCLNPSCGFFLRDHAGNALFRNGRASFTSPPALRNRNISLIGGTYNHNAARQEHTVPSKPDEKTIYTDLAGNPSALKDVKAMEFYGVEDLLIQDVCIRNQTTFALLVANFCRVTIENTDIVLDDYKYANNQDGLHFWGPGSFLSLRNIRGASGDDFIAIAPDERDGVSDITDVTIDGVCLREADQAIRLLSRGKGRLDRVLIKNVTGVFRGLGFIVTPWMEGEGGNYGSIIFDTIDLRCDTKQYDPAPMLFRIGGNIDSLTVRNLHYHGRLAHDLMQIGGSYAGDGPGGPGMPSRIKHLTLENVCVHNDLNAHDYVRLRGAVEDLLVRNVQLLGCRPESRFFVRDYPGAGAARLRVEGFLSDGAR